MNIAHVGFTVSDLDSAIDFFEEHFGFQLVNRQVQDNPYTRATVGVPDAVIENAILDAPDGTGSQLQLLHYRTPLAEGEFAPVHRPGAVHLALEVTDIYAVYETCVAKGVRFTSRPNRINSGRNAGGHITYALGPDGLRVELFQPAPIPQTA